MHKTAKKYISLIGQRMDYEKLELVYFDLAHYLNIRNAQIKHLNWLRQNGYIKIRKTKQVKKIIVGLTEKGKEYLITTNQ